MYPILFDFGEFNLPIIGKLHFFIPTYGFIFSCAAFLILWIWTRITKREGFETSKIVDLGFYTILAGIVGSKLALLIVDFKYYVDYPSEILYLYKVAGVFMGGIVAGLATVIFFAIRNKFPMWKLADTICVPLPLGQAIGRLGCFFAGCCYGREAPGIPWAVSFTSAIAHENTGVPLGLPIHPVQLYQAANDFILFLIMLIIWKFKRFDGQIAWSYIFLYSLGRGIIEFYRGDTGRGVYFHGLISTSQIMGVIGMISSAIILAILYKRSKVQR